ncbi:MAG TPA: VCBS repeat-containing protein, partial [Sphingomicrobium sp.]|nr:VCBS repeat-containing protein [Sphingomicrobium sp.]
MTTFTFDSQHRTLIGTAAGLNGATIGGYLPGDDIQITDSNLNTQNINVSVSGDTLSYNGGSVTVDNLGPGRIVVRNLSAGGVDIRLQQDAHNDFSGDGRSDVLWRSDDGTVHDWLAQADNSGSFAGNTTNLNTIVPTSWHIVGTGDFNGDGRVDVLWRNDDGTVHDWLGQANGSFAGNTANLNTTVPT